MYCCMLGDTFRAPQKRQDKAQRAGNGYSLVKRCNAVMAFLGGSLRASRWPASGSLKAPTSMQQYTREVMTCCSGSRAYFRRKS